MLFNGKVEGFLGKISITQWLTHSKRPLTPNSPIMYQQLKIYTQQQGQYSFWKGKTLSNQSQPQRWIQR